MVKGITNVQVLSGGTKGECIYLVNNSGDEISKGDKVLIDLGKFEVNETFETSVTSSSSYCDWGCIFIDDNMAISFFRNVMKLFIFFNGEWIVKDISNFSVPQSGGFVIHPNGITCMFGFNADANSEIQQGSIINNICNRLMPSDTSYLGRFNGKDYAKSFYYSNVYEYDRYNNTIGDRVGEIATKCCAGYLCESSGNGFVVTAENVVTFFKVGTDGVFSVDNQVAAVTVDSMRIAGWTGCDVGDYLFFATNYSSKYANNSSVDSNVISHLVIYKIVEDKNGVRALECDTGKLKVFQFNDCLIQYNNRNDVLCIGTRDNVYAYKFNREKDVFECINLNLQLKEGSSGYCYRLVLSEGIDKALVAERTSKSDMNYYLYVLGDANKEIVENSAFNYNSSSCFVGFATGNIGSDEKVEINVLLPEKIGVVFETNVDVLDSEIVFKGVA